MDAVGRAARAASVGTGVMLATGASLVAVDGAATSVFHLVVGGLVALVWASLGPIVARADPGNLVAALASSVGLAVAFTTARELGWQVLAARPEVLERLGWLALGLREAFVWTLVALGLLLLYFPDGRVPSERWRALPPAMIVCAAIGHLWGLVDPVPLRPPLEGLVEPLPRPPVWIEALSVIASLGLLALLVACAWSLVARFRTGDTRTRAQIKWLALAGLGVPGFLLSCAAEILLVGEPGTYSLVIGLAAVTGLPVATGIAILRRDLYDVDRWLSAAVSYVLLSLVLGGMFTAVIVGGGLVLGGDSTVSAVVATALTAVALTPVRVRLQRAVDRRLHPRRRAVFDAIAELQRRIHAGEAEPESLEGLLRGVLRDPDLRVGYRVPGAVGLVDAHGEVLGVHEVVPVTLQGEQIGALAPGGGPSSSEFLRLVADATAVLVEVVRLRLQVTRALREVQASRARLVHAGEVERRRLERDLHDSSQQRLVALGMTLRLAQRQLPVGTVDVSGLLDQAVAELGTAVAELREIAHGLRPGCLDEGLRPALYTLASTLPLSVVLDVADDRLPDDVAATLYFVASEAITNAVKHASASHIDVTVVRSDGTVELRVSDDGQGGAVPVTGAGLTGLEDRIAAAGGTLLLESRSGRGTTVGARLPCGS